MFLKPSAELPSNPFPMTPSTMDANRRLAGLADFLEKVPRENLNMSTFGDTHHKCGTSACMAGWAAILYTGHPTDRGELQANSRCPFSEDSLEKYDYLGLHWGMEINFDGRGTHYEGTAEAFAYFFGIPTTVASDLIYGHNVYFDWRNDDIKNYHHSHNSLKDWTTLTGAQVATAIREVLEVYNPEALENPIPVPPMNHEAYSIKEHLLWWSCDASQVRTISYEEALAFTGTSPQNPENDSNAEPA